MPTIETTTSTKLKRRYFYEGCCCCPQKKLRENSKIGNENLNEENNEQKLDKPQEKIQYEEEQQYHEKFTQPLTPGSLFKVKAFVRPECGRFAVNFLCEKHDNKVDIAYHFNPRIAQRYIVRNCRIGGRWSEEENTSLVKFEISRNKQIEIDFVCTENEFFSVIAGKHICGYVYRLPLEKVTGISVEGAVDVYSVEHKKVESYPPSSTQNVLFKIPTRTGVRELPDQQQLEIPFTGHLPQGFKRNTQLEIRGRVKILPFAFYINLQQGGKLWPHPNIPLHLNPRFRTTFGSYEFVRNSWLDGAWGKEERSPGFHFKPGAPFCLAIRKLDDRYTVWIDGSLAGEFEFRTPHNIVDTVFVNGDVVLYSIDLNTKINDEFFVKCKETPQG